MLNRKATKSINST